MYLSNFQTEIQLSTDVINQESYFSISLVPTEKFRFNWQIFYWKIIIENITLTEFNKWKAIIKTYIKENVNTKTVSGNKTETPL